jgi:phosphotransferase system  glucose/maltose/N-acetylglucosamine-specific IIC component
MNQLITQARKERIDRTETQIIWRRIAFLWRAEFFSPKDFIRRALLIAIAYMLVKFTGLQEFTTVLNGTMGSVEMGWWPSAFLGLASVIIYLAFVILAPVLFLAAAFLVIWKRIAKPKQFPNEVL